MSNKHRRYLRRSTDLLEPDYGLAAFIGICLFLGILMVAALINYW